MAAGKEVAHSRARRLIPGVGRAGCLSPLMGVPDQFGVASLVSGLVFR